MTINRISSKLLSELDLKVSYLKKKFLSLLCACVNFRLISKIFGSLQHICLIYLPCKLCYCRLYVNFPSLIWNFAYSASGRTVLQMFLLLNSSNILQIATVIRRETETRKGEGAHVHEITRNDLEAETAAVREGNEAAQEGTIFLC